MSFRPQQGINIINTLWHFDRETGTYYSFRPQQGINIINKDFINEQMGDYVFPSPTGDQYYK